MKITKMMCSCSFGIPGFVMWIHSSFFTFLLVLYFTFSEKSRLQSGFVFLKNVICVLQKGKEVKWQFRCVDISVSILWTSAFVLFLPSIPLQTFTKTKLVTPGLFLCLVLLVSLETPST